MLQEPKECSPSFDKLPSGLSLPSTLSLRTKCRVEDRTVTVRLRSLSLRVRFCSPSLSEVEGSKVEGSKVEPLGEPLKLFQDQAEAVYPSLAGLDTLNQEAFWSVCLQADSVRLKSAGS